MTMMTLKNYLISIMTISLLSYISMSTSSWIKLLNKQTVLETNLAISYQLDKTDHPALCLLYAGSALLYTAPLPGGEGTLTIPCGVITHAGTHSLAVSHMNTSAVVAGTVFEVSWPVMAVSVPHRIETYTMDLVVRVSFTKNICTPLSTTRNNNNLRVLQGGENGLVSAWLKVEKCNTKACEDNKVMYIDKVENFYKSHYNTVNIPCRNWGEEGIFRVVLGAEVEKERNVKKSESVIVRSEVFHVDWSSEYELWVNRAAVNPWWWR